MDLSNAKLQRIDAPGPATTGGDVAYVNGSAIDVDCVLDEPTSNQKYLLGAVISSATAVLYVHGTGLTIEKGYRVVVRLEDEAAVTYRVIYKRNRVKDSVSHWELFLQV